MAKDNRIIHIHSDALNALIDEVVTRIEQRDGIAIVERWINSEEAMKSLNIKSRTTLQTLRDEGKIRFSQPAKKIILFDRFSILEYIASHAQETF